MPYTVGEMAKQIGVAPSTLRYYDKEGLLPFVERSGGGIRLFKDSDREWLAVIECLKKTGMPIREIKRFVDLCREGDVTIDERLQLIKRRRDAVLKQMESLNETLSLLEYKLWYYETAKRAGTCSIHDENEEIPARFRAVREKAKGKDFSE